MIVHTDTEKKLQKLLRKEEKKKQVQRKEPSHTGSSNVNKGGDFDPSLLRILREEQLSEARVLQLYHQRQSSERKAWDQEKKADPYPYVFDSLMKIRQSSAFIAGAKILLPENIQRTESRDAEEIHIPPVDSMR